MAQNSSLDVLQQLINYTSVRGKVINKNIANVNTEYYQREEVNFGEVMDEVFLVPFKNTHEKHIPLQEENEFNIEKDTDMTENNGVNNVMIDEEMADLAENTILFKFAARKLNKHFSNLQNVIKGGQG